LASKSNFTNEIFQVQRVKEENWVLWVWLVSLAAKENKDLPVFPGLENPV